MPFGHYVSLSASGPGPVLWYKSDGTWVQDSAERLVFLQVQIAVHTAIFALPAGYLTKINFETVNL